MRAAEGLIWKILEVESRAGRLEGAFAADAELGLMWRSQVVLTEACRSVSLEDIHVFEGDVIFRHLENRMTDPEAARGAAAASELMRVISAPGDLTEEPHRTVARCWDAAVSHGENPPDFDVFAIADRLLGEMEKAPTPILGALRVATVFQAMTESNAPSAERLIFMAAEHSLRGMGKSRVPAGQAGLLPRMDAAWIVTPSIALTMEGFRAWSPGSERGGHDILAGAAQGLDHALGAIPLLLRWREEARAEARGRHGKSKLRDLVELALRVPILTAAHVREMIGCSERAALYLMKEAEDLGILRLITPRRSYRVWAAPQMAQLLRMRGGSALSAARAPVRVPETRPSPAEEARAEKAAPAETRDALEERDDLETESWEERSARVLAELDDALAQADAVLAKYRKVREN